MKLFKCSKCNEEKIGEMFSPDTKKISGLSSICKTCRNFFIKEKRDKLRGFSVAPMVMHKKLFEKHGIFKCYMCKKERGVECFDNNKNSPTGKSKRCKECAKDYNAKRYLKNREPFLKKSKEHYKKATHLYKIRARKAAMKLKYGLTVDQANEMIARAKNSCEICGISQDMLTKRLSIDHNHITGKVRGVLCYSCNHAIGRLKSDNGLELLQSAIEYIKRTENYV
jgi:Recombination endonuclease VII